MRVTVARVVNGPEDDVLNFTRYWAAPRTGVQESVAGSTSAPEQVRNPHELVSRGVATRVSIERACAVTRVKQLQEGTYAMPVTDTSKNTVPARAAVKLHISAIGYEPPNAPALWRPERGPAAPLFGRFERPSMALPICDGQKIRNVTAPTPVAPTGRCRGSRLKVISAAKRCPVRWRPIVMPSSLVPAIAAVILSAGAYFVSTGLNTFWPLGWIAPLPILLLAFTRSWRATAPAALAAYLLGSLNVVPILRQVVPPPVMVLLLLLPAGVFAATVLAARYVARRAPAAVAALGFPLAWTTYEFLLSRHSPHGTVMSLAYSQTDVLPLLQLASLTGIWGMTFVLTLVPSAIAAAWARRSAAALLPAIVIGGATLGYGTWRLAQPRGGPTVRVGLAVEDGAVGRWTGTRIRRSPFPSCGPTRTASTGWPRPVAGRWPGREVRGRRAAVFGGGLPAAERGRAPGARHRGGRIEPQRGDAPAQRGARLRSRRRGPRRIRKTSSRAGRRGRIRERLGGGHVRRTGPIRALTTASRPAASSGRRTFGRGTAVGD